ncbi:hypothetical protein [Nitrosococcus watsonii]|uniref:Phosphate-selective porin O and P n=1 Tax=Nitrosococcus watsoni (strain C-113) TaxID=105559 RepID=D8KC79_NITWC|nr:hypothetical protein [Nitrosococcus watsonii]ADJ29750.1 conserved hypothetical protein [Nitrosococcus watsonii C-113]
MRKKKSLVRVGLAALTLAANLPLKAAEEMPQTMEEMWRIIQQQQKEIEALKAKSQPVEEEAQPEVSKEASESTKESPKTATSASEENTETKAQVKELEHKTGVLAEAVESLRTAMHIPEEFKYKSMYGFGPAASKVYQAGKGLSIGGYGNALYQNFVNGDGKDNADLERVVLYVGYKFTDRILFNSEIEFEHGTTGEGDEEKGEVSVEFASLDFFIDPRFNVRAGMLLLPMGFINLIHEPPFFFGNKRPEVEQRIIPSTWHENGVGLFGQLWPGLTYTMYGVNGLNAEEFSSRGIRDGRQAGSKALAEDLAFVGRLEYSPPAMLGLSFGGSAYVGNSGQDQSYAGQDLDVFTQLYEGHLQWQYRGWWLRALGAWGHIGDAEALSAAKGETIGKSNFGWYTELAYNLLPLVWPETIQYLAPFFRFEQLNTIASAPAGFSDKGGINQDIYQVGINYKPIPNVVIKADYRNFVGRDSNPSAADEFNLGLGFIF